MWTLAWKPLSPLARFNAARYGVWSKNSNGLRWHNLRFPRFVSNRFRRSSHSAYNPPSTTRSMRSERVQNDLGATAGLRYRNGRPRTSVTERVSGGGEPHPESPGEGSAVTLTRRKSHIGGDRSPAGTKGAGRSGVHSATGHDSGLVSEAHRKQI